MLNFVGQNTVQDPGIDSTTYIYQSASQPVPLASYFLNFQFLSSSDSSENLNTLTTREHSSKISNLSDSPDFSIQYSDFMLVTIVFLFILLAYVKFYGKNYLNRLMTSIFNYSYSVSFFKEKNMANVLNSNILMFVYFVSFTLMFKVTLEYFGFFMTEMNHWIQFVVYFLFIVGITLIHYFGYLFIGKLFGYFRLANEYLFYLGNLLKIIGLLYIVLTLGAFFSYDSWKFVFIYSAIVITGIAHLIKISRLLMILFNNQFSLYYLILYFCALEVIPVALLFKFVILMDQNTFPFLKTLV